MYAIFGFIATQTRKSNFYGVVEIKLTILQGDVFERMAEIPDNSIDLTITSPPYSA
jgi:predicted methyltransferase